MPLVIENQNLSLAWAHAFVATARAPGRREIDHLTVVVTNPDGLLPEEVPEIRSLLDRILLSHGKRDCDTTASTIFPMSMWNRALDKKVLFERYRRVFPKIKGQPGNQYGTYFQRLIRPFVWHGPIGLDVGPVTRPSRSSNQHAWRLTRESRSAHIPSSKRPLWNESST
jgi:hypothetical protein